LAASDHFVYVMSVFTNTVSGFKIDQDSGSLTPVPGSPFTGGDFSLSVAIDPKERFVYVTSEPTNIILGYAIDQHTGSLTPVPGSPFPTGANPWPVAVEPKGNFAYVGTNSAPGNIFGYAINQHTGALSPIAGSTNEEPGPAISIAPDPAGRFIYVAGTATNSVSGYAINQQTGALTAVPSSPFPAGSSPLFVRLAAGRCSHGNEQFAYVANALSNNISGYTVNTHTGALTGIAGSPFPAGAFPASLAVACR
jgi:6-phosphogluconolactonase (cycloisomerase 2 family)